MEDDVKAIIERLEAASGPDEELDRAIFDVVTGGVFGPENAKFWHSTSMLSRAANEFTHSIDAALSLVPEEENWSVRYQDEADIERWYEATVGEHYVEVRSSPAIALVIAALRARANKWEG